MVKQWLIKITDHDNIWYDSEEKVYRYRMHCPNCNTASLKCRCYEDLDVLLDNIDDGIADYTCSAKCALLLNDDNYEVGDAMQAADLTKDLKQCLSKLTEQQLNNVLKGYDLHDILMALYEAKSNMPFSHLHPETITHDEKLEIIFAVGDIKDILREHDISYYPNIDELTEEQAQKVLGILIDNGDFDYPSGEDCTL